MRKTLCWCKFFEIYVESSRDYYQPKPNLVLNCALKNVFSARSLFGTKILTMGLKGFWARFLGVS